MAANWRTEIKNSSIMKPGFGKTLGQVHISVGGDYVQKWLKWCSVGWWDWSVLCLRQHSRWSLSHIWKWVFVEVPLMVEVRFMGLWNECISYWYWVMFCLYVFICLTVCSISQNMFWMDLSSWNLHTRILQYACRLEMQISGRLDDVTRVETRAHCRGKLPG